MRRWLFISWAATLIAGSAAAGIREDTLSVVRDPNVAFLAVLLGILGIYCEFVYPGLVVPGVAGGILALLGVSAILAFPLRFAGVALLLCAVLLFVLSARSRARNVFGVAAAIAMTSGAAVLMEGPSKIYWGIAIGGTLPFTGITVLLSSLAEKARRNKRVTVGRVASSGG